MRDYGKSEGRHFNLIDVLIILAVLLIIAVFIFRAQIIAMFSDSERRTECIISFQCDSLPAESLGYINAGSQLVWLERDKTLGTLESISSAPATVYVPEPDGTYRKVSDPDNFSVSGYLRSDVIYDSGCYIGGTAFLAPGMTLTVYSESVQFEITVISIEY